MAASLKDPYALQFGTSFASLRAQGRSVYTTMRKIIIALIIVGASSAFMIGFSSPAYALLFSDFVDFGPGNSTTTVNDSGTVASRSWTHDITDVIGGNPIGNITILTATLAFRYKETDSSEHWFLNQSLGDLTLTGNSDVTSNHPLGVAALADLQADGIITFTTSEDTSGSDSFKEYDATLSGTYQLKPTNTEMPEPATASLLGLGLMGLGLVSRRKKEVPYVSNNSNSYNS